MIMIYNLPNAKENILAGIKIHFVRADRSDNWKEGRKIHHCIKSYHPTDRDGFLKNTCISVQRILMVHHPENNFVSVNIDRRRLKRIEVVQFALNDGFSSVDELIKYFFGKGETMFGGKIIHWTSLKY